MKANLSTDHPDYPDLSVSYVLRFCSDFKEEVGAMENFVGDCGHIVLFSPKGYPEVSGCGIEFN